MNSGRRLLLVEMVLPDGDVSHPGKMLDMVMLTVPGGEERTASQYSALLDQAGFQMTPGRSVLGTDRPLAETAGRERPKTLCA
jgi:hypothetical protein